MALDGRTRMLLVGDVVGTGHPGGLRFFLEKAAPELRSREIVYGNCEFPITDQGEYDRSKYWISGRHMNPEDAKALADAGFHVMSVANNHVMDYGEGSFLQTLELLDSHGIAHCGGGANLAAALKPAVIEKNGLRVAFLAFTSVCLPAYRALEARPGVALVQVTTAYVAHHRVLEQPGIPPIVLTIPNQEDMEAVRAAVRSARENADLVVVAWHWGVSQGHRKRVPYQMEAGRACIDAGASIVVGHHPHVVQGVETYRKGVIFYSFGNFIFWTGESPNPKIMDRNTFIADCEVGRGGLRRLSLRPMRANAAGQPEPVEDGQKEGIFDSLVADSEEFGTRFRYESGRLVVEV